MAHDAGLGLRCGNRWRSSDSRGCNNRRDDFWLFSHRSVNHGRFNDRRFNDWLFSHRRFFNHNRRFRHRRFCGFHHRLSNHFILRSDKLRLLCHRCCDHFRMCGLHVNGLWLGNRRFRLNDYRRLLFHDGNGLLRFFCGYAWHFSNHLRRFRRRFGMGFILLLNHRRILQLVLRTGDRITNPHFA